LAHLTAGVLSGKAKEVKKGKKASKKVKLNRGGGRRPEHRANKCQTGSSTLPHQQEKLGPRKRIRTEIDRHDDTQIAVITYAVTPLGPQQVGGDTGEENPKRRIGQFLDLLPKTTLETEEQRRGGILR